MTMAGRIDQRGSLKAPIAARNYACMMDRSRAASSVCVLCIRGSVFSEGISETVRRCLSTCIPSRNISITATSISTTDIIVNSETYNKNATVLPSSRSVQKANMREDRM